MHSTHTSESEIEDGHASAVGSLWLEGKMALEVYTTAGITVQLDLPLTYGLTNETPMDSESSATDMGPDERWIIVLASLKK